MIRTGFGKFTRTSPPPLSLVPGCAKCGLHLQCHSPKMPVAGQGRRKILILGEAPGEKEDLRNKPFVGPAGKLLQEELARNGVDLFTDCWVTNALRCRPKNNILPESSISLCRPYVIQAVTELKPEVIIPLGAAAVKSLIGWLWREDPGPITRWVGWKIPVQKINAWVCPTWHPSYFLHAKEDSAVSRLMFNRDLEAACKLQGRPWQEVPNYVKQVQVEYQDNNAAAIITYHAMGTDPVTFDYETNRLKPDHPDAQVFCCSVSDGEQTTSFPWHGKAIKAMGELLRSDVPKIGWNIKFEERWTRRVFGHGVRNWKWDGMLAAHVLDNRRGITGAKFQAFALMGQESYNREVEFYLKAPGGNQENRIKEAPLDKILKYGGMDSLLEWEIAQIQMKKMGVTP